MNQVSPSSLTDFLYFFLQVILSVGGIWLAIYLYLRQNRDSQNETLEKISRNYENINKQLREITRDIADIKGQHTTFREASEMVKSTQKLTENIILNTFTTRIQPPSSKLDAADMED